MVRAFPFGLFNLGAKDDHDPSQLPVSPLRQKLIEDMTDGDPAQLHPQCGGASHRSSGDRRTPKHVARDDDYRTFPGIEAVVRSDHYRSPQAAHGSWQVIERLLGLVIPFPFRRDRRTTWLRAARVPMPEPGVG